MQEIVEVSAENQVITVQPGISIPRLNQHLADFGLCLPFLIGSQGSGYPLRLSHALDYDVPNFWAAQHGSWRDWVLGMQIVLANGDIVKAGAKVVKNVTGYDLHKLMIGARGTLGVISEVTLRVITIPSLKPLEIEKVGSFGQVTNVYQRVKRSDWSGLCRKIKEGSQTYILDHAAHQACYAMPVKLLPRTEDDFIWEQSEGYLHQLSPAEKGLTVRTMQIFDPTKKLNPGEFRNL
jgi:hypothetical protein